MAEKQAAKILGTLGYEIRTPGQASHRPLGSEEQAYCRMLADRMRYLLDSPRGTNESVLRCRLVVMSGSRRGPIPGTGGVEDQVYPVAKFTSPMLWAAIVHGTRLAIRDNLDPPARVLCPEERRLKDLPRISFMVMNMTGLQPSRGSPPRTRRPPERYADRFARPTQGGRRASTRGAGTARMGEKRRRISSGGDGGRAAKKATGVAAAALEEDDDVQIPGVCPPLREGLGSGAPPRGDS